ncbi:hypothetical protein ACSBM8_05775 [Sphingomonas sp. ASY06-1R]|uniref:hypothetical protein n=1 Tax=Sphingomonas sp. ASY06-1R TaxID=3445771 RepID=UPI003FA1CC75
MMNAIEWPQGYLPGYTDNFVSNEAIVLGLTSAEIWPFLAEATRWPSYYANSANVRFLNSDSPTLALGRRFSFETFGGPIEAEVVEYVAPTREQPGRIAWHGWGGEGDIRLDVHHAWLVEDLDGGRVRILTQETQNGAPAKGMATAWPNPMLNGHQMWLDALTAAARGTGVVGRGRRVPGLG